MFKCVCFFSSLVCNFWCCCIRGVIFICNLFSLFNLIFVVCSFVKVVLILVCLFRIFRFFCFCFLREFNCFRNCWMLFFNFWSFCCCFFWSCWFCLRVFWCFLNLVDKFFLVVCKFWKWIYLVLILFFCCNIVISLFCCCWVVFSFCLRWEYFCISLLYCCCWFCSNFC